MAAQVCSDAIGRIDTRRGSGCDVRFEAKVARRTDRRSERHLCHIAIHGSRCDPGVRRQGRGRVRRTHHSNKRAGGNRDHEGDMKRTSRDPASRRHHARSIPRTPGKTLNHLCRTDELAANTSTTTERWSTRQKQPAVRNCRWRWRAVREAVTRGGTPEVRRDVRSPRPETSGRS